jgi:hypothetical protein
MFSRSALLAVALTALTALPSAAVTLVPNSGWLKFSFGDVGSSRSGEPYTFTLSNDSTLKVTDAYRTGDRFQIFNSGSSLGFTSLPIASAVDARDDYDLSYSDARWSSGTWVLGAGSYSITGLTTVSPFGGGDGALMVSSGVPGVPIPAAGLMLLTGLAGFAGLRRKRDT